MLLGALCGGAFAAPCMQGIIVSATPGASAGRIEICAEIAKQVPELQAALDKVLQAQAASGDRLREIERLLSNVNAAGSRVDTKSVTLARSIAEQLSASNEKSASASLRAIRGLSDRLEEVIERLDAASRDQRQADALRSGLAGPIGDAVARLDLEQANRMIDDLAAIREQVSATHTQIEAMRNEARLRDAMSLLLEASRTVSRGEMGQTAALADLIAAGRTFENTDLFQGVAFRNGRLAQLRASRANLKYADVSGSDLSGSALGDSSMQAITAARARFDASDLVESRLPIAVATDASFERAKLDKTVWLASDLQRASFRAASLRGASFLLADLRGANFSGADLTNASFNGADLRGADFSGALVSNTDFGSALMSATQLNATQRAGACTGRREYGGIALVMVLPDPVPYGTRKYLDIGHTTATVSWSDPQGTAAQCSAVPPSELPEFYDVRTTRISPFRMSLPERILDASRIQQDIGSRMHSLLHERIVARVRDAHAMGWKVGCPFSYGWGCEELVKQGIVAKD